MIADLKNLIEKQEALATKLKTASTLFDISGAGVMTINDITEQTKHVINSGGVSYDHGWDGYKHKLSVFASLQHIGRDSYYGAQRDPNAYGKTDDLTWVTGATYTWQIGKLLFSPATFMSGV